MTALGIALAAFVFWAWIWPDEFGKWAGSVRASYRHYKDGVRK
jgi:hypothetical protein